MFGWSASNLADLSCWSVAVVGAWWRPRTARGIESIAVVARNNLELEARLLWGGKLIVAPVLCCQIVAAMDVGQRGRDASRWPASWPGKREAAEELHVMFAAREA